MSSLADMPPNSFWLFTKIKCMHKDFGGVMIWCTENIQAYFQNRVRPYLIHRKML